MPVAISKPAFRSNFNSIRVPRVVSRRPPPHLPAQSTPAPLLLRILTTSLLAHLLLVGILGSGLPKPLVRPKRPALPPTKAELVEDVKLQEAPPPEQPKPLDLDQALPAPDTPAVAKIDLPPLSQVEPISAVPASVPVAFGIEVKGRVRLVSDPSKASGAVGGREMKDPVAIDGNSSQGKNLLLPMVVYPRDALAWHQQGTVVLEFHTSATGEIYDIKVRTGSGYPILDRTAMNNLAKGRWVGTAGYFLKTYEFNLD
jgi:TonB family protein